MENMEAEQDISRSSASLADRMKAATYNHHRTAEKTGVVHEILNRKINEEKYTLYLRNLHPIYSALEDELMPTSEAANIISPFLNKMIHRTQFLELDLIRICGSRTWQTLPILDSSLSYSNDIKTIRSQNPIALLGHIYVRYLGDMNGGQVLEKLLKKSLNFLNDPYSFYRYPAIEDIRAFRKDYREMFNRPRLNAGQDRLIIDTAVQGFNFNIALSKEIISFVNS